MSGKLLIVAGFSCTGKTTYIQASHNSFKNNIQHRYFYTNRLPRSKKELDSSPDYTFITNNEYLQLSTKPDWHWTTWFDFNYGFHVTSEIERIYAKEKIIIGVFPTTSYLQDMRKIHGSCNVVSILLNVDYNIIKSRLLKRPPHEHERIIEFNQREIDCCAKDVDIVFTPTNNLEIDCQKFLMLAKQVLAL